MNIKELIFDVTETKTYQITISEENGWDMPKTPKELIEIDILSYKPTSIETEITYYEVNQGDSK
jgi:hypothetical protein